MLCIACSPPDLPPGRDTDPSDVNAPDASMPDSGQVDAGEADAGGPGAAPDAGTVDKSATCATTFGQELSPGFGRLDGTVLAVVPPNDHACAGFNSSHLVLQLMLNGWAYRMVVDVLSNRGNPDVFFLERKGPLIGGAWTEGWHHNRPLDYFDDLHVDGQKFTEMNEAELVATLTSKITLGAHVSVYATSAPPESDSAHLVHRNLPHQDGAIVLDPDGPNPRWLLMHFDDQTF
jgi:hypothetical protein